MDLNAGLGPLPLLSVLDARVKVDAQFGARWSGGSGGKLSLAGIGFGGFGVVGTLNGQAFDGSIQAVIPLDGDGNNQVALDPSQLAATDAWVDVVGKLRNVTNGITINTSTSPPSHHTNAPGQLGGVDAPLSSSEIDAVAMMLELRGAGGSGGNSTSTGALIAPRGDSQSMIFRLAKNETAITAIASRIVFKRIVAPD